MLEKISGKYARPALYNAASNCDHPSNGLHISKCGTAAEQTMSSHQQVPSLESLIIIVLASVLLIATVIPNAYANSPSQNATRASQAPTTRYIIIEWTKTLTDQDRFYPDFIIVNQGDTVALTFINNDTVVHDFVIGPPYNIVVNASVPGLYDDVTGQLITTPATRNSPGVQVSGTPGNLSATYSFVASYPGIFEFVCSYHINVGMIGYLVVLAPNASGITQPNVPNQTLPQSSTLIPARSPGVAPSSAMCGRM